MKNLFFILGSVAFVSLCGCNNYSLIFNKQKMFDAAKSKGVIVYQNGFGSSETFKMTRELARDLKMAHVCGDSKNIAIELMQEGQDSEYGNHIIFHSMGSSFAKVLTDYCDKKDIEIKKVHSLEAFTKETFPENVGEVVNYTAPNKWVFGEHSCSGKNGAREYKLSNGNHLTLPNIASKVIKGEIMGRRYSQKPQRVGKNLNSQRVLSSARNR